MTNPIEAKLLADLEKRGGDDQQFLNGDLTVEEQRIEQERIEQLKAQFEELFASVK